MRTLRLLLLLLICHLHVNAQLPAGLDSVLTRTLDSMRISMNIKSLSAAMVFPDFTWSKASGISSTFPNTPANPSMAYLIGSTTKTITAACVLQLADENKLSLNDSLHKFIPDTIPNINPNITVRQLLQHKTGIYDVLLNPAWNQASLANTAKVWDAEELLRTFNLPATAAPGGAWDYSNPNYFLLGIIIQKVTGKPFYEALRERFFTPLALNSIAIPAFEPLNAPVAHAWLDLNGDGITEDGHAFYMNWKSLNSAAGAAGGYFATATDAANWIRIYQRGDLLSPDMMSQMRTTVSASGTPGNAYGLGIMRHTLSGELCWGHPGDLVYTSSTWYFPSKDMGIAVLGNDQKFNSWKSLPVVAALVKACKNWEATTQVIEPATEMGTLAFPNPFSTNLTYSVFLKQAGSRVQAVLYDPLGRPLEVQTIAEAGLGWNDLHFSTLALEPNGIYLLELQLDGVRTKIEKVVKTE